MRGDLGINPKENSYGERKLAPPTTARALYKVPETSRRLDLTQAPLYMTRTPVTPYITDYTMMAGRLLTGSSFYNFANTVAILPQQGIEGMMGDWILPDEPEKFRKGLVHDHEEYLKGDWTEFQRHRKLFMRTLYIEHEVSKVVSTIRPYDLENFHYTNSLDGHLVHGWLELRDDPSRIPDMFVRFLSDRNIPLGRYGDNEQMKRVLGFSQLSRDERAELASEFFVTKNSQEWEALVRSENLKNGYVLVKSTDKKGTPYWDKNGVYIESAGNENAQVTIGGGYRFITTPNPIQMNRMYSPYVIADKKTIESSVNGVVPTASWRTTRLGTTVTREIVMNQPSDDIAAAFLDASGIQVPDGLQFDSLRFNPLAGLMLLPYYFPGIKKPFPKELPLDNPHVRNMMSESQSPALYLRYRKRLQKVAQFFAPAEQHADKYLAA